MSAKTRGAKHDDRGAPRPGAPARSGPQGWRKRLSALDSAFLFFERPNQLMHVGCVALIDGSVSFPAFVDLVKERLCALPRYRQHPVRGLLDLERPVWEDDPHFDVRRHVHHVALPAPGGEAELHELVDQVFSAALDANHPVWECHLIDGLEGGRTAMLWKIHHCMIDGISGAQVIELITDPARPAAKSPADAMPPGGGAPAAHGPVDQPIGGALAARITGFLAAALDPSAAVARARDALEAASTVGSLLLEPSTPLPFNAPLGDRRRAVWVSLPLDHLMGIRGDAGCKVNDVVLAIVTGALRQYLSEHGVDLTRACVRSVVPVSLRRPEDHLTLGNMVTAMLPKLPIGVADPVERLRRVAAEMNRLKDRGQARAAGMAMAVADSLPPALEAAFARLAPDRPLVNTVCTNVPGPRDARLLLGRPMLELHGLVPLFLSMGVEFAVVSYADRLSICATADAELIPDPERLATALRDAEEELRRAMRVAHQRDVEAAQSSVPGPRVADLMTREVATVGVSDTLLHAHRMMRRLRVRHLPVVDADHRVVGIVTKSDVLAAQTSSMHVETEEARVRVLGKIEVRDVMETHVSLAAPDEPAALAGRRLVRHKIGCLPVATPSGSLVGIVTSDDFVRWAAERMETMPALARASGA